jgi:hypothetical protein
VGALVVWAACWLCGTAALVAARRRGARVELKMRRRLAPVIALEHLALAAALGSGVWLMAALDLDLGQRRWLDVKLGLVAFLVLPLEGMHAWVTHGWIARGLGETHTPPFSRTLERGIGMDDMVRALSALLLGLAVPLLAWLSLAEPF